MANVRPQKFEGDQGANGLNGVLLQNILLPDYSPESAVLQSLHQTLSVKNIPNISDDKIPNPVISIPCLNEQLMNFCKMMTYSSVPFLIYFSWR